MGDAVGEMDKFGMQGQLEIICPFSTTFISTCCYFLQYCHLAYFCLKGMPCISYIQS